MAEGAEPSLTAAEKVIVTPKNLKSYVWKCFGFWSVDCKLVEPTAKLVCKLCKQELVYHSTTSHLSLHLKNRQCETTSQKVPPKKIWKKMWNFRETCEFFCAPPATSSLSAARQE